MKKLLCLLAAVVALAVAGADRGVWREYVVLGWDYEGTNQIRIMDGVYEDPLMSFNLYYQTNVGTITNWILLTNLPPTARTAKIAIAPGSYFFAVTASNWWGESVFSNVAWVNGPPSSDSRLFMDYRVEVVP